MLQEQETVIILLDVVLRLENSLQVTNGKLHRSEAAVVHPSLQSVNGGLLDNQAIAIPHGKQVGGVCIFLLWKVVQFRRAESCGLLL